MAQSWTSSFPSLTGWTQTPNNGVITAGAGSVEIAIGAADAMWSAASKLGCILTYPFSSMNFTTTVAYLVVAATIDSMVCATANERVGVGFFEDDQNFVAGGLRSPAADKDVQRIQSVSNSFSYGSESRMASYPIAIEVHWNNSGSTVTTTRGDTLADNNAHFYASVNEWSTWTFFDGPDAAVLAASSIVLFGENFASAAVTATFGDVTVTAPNLPACREQVLVVSTGEKVSGDFIIKDSNRLLYEVQTGAGCKPIVVPFSAGRAGRRLTVTPPSSSIG